MLAKRALKSYIKRCDEAQVTKGTRAKLVGVSRTTYNNWESALKDDHDVDYYTSTLERIIKATGVLQDKLEKGELPGKDAQNKKHLEKQLL